MLYADQKTYLVELLMKQDQMSMACSIESRVPFLDHHFVEFAMRVPDRLKIRGNTQKYILKKAVEDLIPAEILYRKKMGFPTPLTAWFRDPKAEPLWAALSSRDGFIASYLDLGAVISLIERHRDGFEDSTDRLWRLLNLQIWGDVFITGREERWREGGLVSKSAALEV
jgi:asparagine synthase (glutamine-hydrolysing)